MKKNSILVLFFTLCISTVSVAQSYKFPDESSYTNGKIYFKNNNRIEVNNLVIKNDHLTFINKATKVKGEYDLNETYIIKVSAGTQAGRYALYSGLLFGLSAALGVAQANVEIASDPYKTRSDVSAGAIIGGFTVAGILIGGLVGASKEKWRTIYVNEQTSLIKSFKYDFCFIPKNNAIAFNLTLDL